MEWSAWSFLKCQIFATGTIKLGDSIAEATELNAFSLVGGGDSVAFAKQYGYDEKSFLRFHRRRSNVRKFGRKRTSRSCCYQKLIYKILNLLNIESFRNEGFNTYIFFGSYQFLLFGKYFFESF